MIKRGNNMIKIDNLSYSFPQKDLYKNVSFTLEEGQHCAFIGASGNGKSTLIDIIMDPENYMFDGKLEKDENCRIGYVSQFSQVDKTREMSVFEYIAEPFIKLQEEIASLCEEMGTSDDIETLLEKYQVALDAFDAIDGDNFENNINKKLNLANLTNHRDKMISELSGGEFKLIQVIKEMLNTPDLMIMDEPDVFLDFENLNALKNLINSYKKTMLVITHNRYLLNHCFNKIIHLENMELQEFDGRYIDYNLSLLQTKIEMQEMAIADEEEIARNEALIEILQAMQNEFLPLDQDNRKSYFYEKRSLYNHVKFNYSHDMLLARTALFMFLNKTCFNGLYRVNSKGLYNVPVGAYKNPLICDTENILAVSEKLQNVTIHCGDFRDSMSFIDSNTFVYFDPPYRPISSTSGFTSYTQDDFTDEQQNALAIYYKELSLKGTKLLLSNSDPKNYDETDDYFDSLYKDFHIDRVNAVRMINSKATGRGKIKELLISNYEVNA